MNPDSRLVLLNIELLNFKTFYGKRIVGDFHSQFTSIVGPNGSGKSNVTDALLFVLGQRTKKMRQNTLTGLIHNSAKHSKLSKCSVSITFAKVDQENKIIPGSNFSVSRDVKASGESNYYINNSKVKRKDVTDTLRREGIDLDQNRFLIKQGEVQLISLMQPKATSKNQTGLLEYIEEVIGSNVFVNEIEETEAELVKANEEREQIAERVAISQRDLDALVGARDEALRYLELEKEMKLVDAKRLFNNKEEVEESLQKSNKKIEEFEEKMKLKNEKNDNLENEVKKNEESIKKSEKELKKLKAKYDEASKILNALKNDSTKLKTEKEGAESLIKENETNNKTAEKEIEASKQIITTKQKEKEECQAKIQTASEELEQAKLELEEKTNEVKSEIEKLQEQLQQKKDEFALENEEFLKIESQVTQAQDEIKAINRRVEDSKNMRREKEEALEKSKRAIDELHALIPEKSEAINNQRARREELKQIIDSNERELESVQHEAREIGVKYNQMKREFEKSSHKSRVLNCIMNLKRETGNENIYGRLGNLGTIDPKYDIPISTAAGKKLDYIVVQGVKDAELCIAELKRQRIGDGNFIALDKLQSDKLDQVMKSQPPEDTELIMHKIQIEKENYNKFLPAFFNAFRDTLIAPNLEVAKRVGYGRVRRRVVTMKGEIVDRSGVMSGGGNQTAKGGMSTVDEKQLANTKDHLAKLDETSRNIRQVIENSRREFAQIHIDAAETDLKKMEMDLQQHQQQAEYFQEQLSRMTDFVQSEDDLQKVDELQRFINDNKDDLESHRSSVESLRTQMQNIEKEISEIVSIRTKDQKEKLASIEKKLDAIRKNSAKSDAAIKAAERKIIKFEKSIKENNETIDNAKKDLDKVNEKLTSTKEKKINQKEEVKELSTETKKIETDINEIQENGQKCKAKLNKLKVKLEQMKTEFSKLKSENKGIKKELEAITSRFEKLGINQDDFGDLQNKTIEELELQRAAIESKLSQLDCNLSAIQEYEDKEKVHNQHLKDFSQADAHRNGILAHCNSLKQQRLEMFMEGFTKIAQKLKETYQILTLGGDAELEFEDRYDPFSQGIRFSVRPPGKSWKQISNLSGGEQTLSSLSLVFSLHLIKPTPFYIMDEIDAALDPRNTSIVGNYLREISTNVQLIIVSLRNQLFELAYRLVGIFKVTDCASAITIDNYEDHSENEDAIEENVVNQE